MKTYRVGIIGFGFIGKVHAYGHLNMPLFYDPVPLPTRITHVVTSRAVSAEKARRTIGADVAATDYRVVTENPDVDIVHICTPNHLHKDALLSAMQSQKHIYCDKPLVATMDEAASILETLADYHGVAQMTFQTRFFPATLRAKEIIDAGMLGDLLAFRVSFLHGGNANPKAPLKWRLTAAAGGGAIADLASHVLDSAEWLMGPIASVMAATQIAYPMRPSAELPGMQLPVDAEDSAVWLARLSSGAVGTMEATKLATGSEDEIRIEIHGSRGALRFNGMDPHHLEFHDATASDQPHGGLHGWNRIDAGQRYGAPAAGFPTPKSSIGWLRAHVACLANFLQAVADGQSAEPSLRQGLRVQSLMESLRQSAAKQCWIDVTS